MEGVKMETKTSKKMATFNIGREAWEIMQVNEHINWSAFIRKAIMNKNKVVEVIDSSIK